MSLLYNITAFDAISFKDRLTINFGTNKFFTRNFLFLFLLIKKAKKEILGLCDFWHTYFQVGTVCLQKNLGQKVKVTEMFKDAIFDHLWLCP